MSESIELSIEAYFPEYNEEIKPFLEKTLDIPENKIQEFIYNFTTFYNLVDGELINDFKHLVTVIDFVTDSGWYDDLKPMLREKFPGAIIGMRANFIEQVPFEDCVIGAVEDEN